MTLNLLCTIVQTILVYHTVIQVMQAAFLKKKNWVKLPIDVQNHNVFVFDTNFVNPVDGVENFSDF